MIDEAVTTTDDTTTDEEDTMTVVMMTDEVTMIEDTTTEVLLAEGTMKLEVLIPLEMREDTMIEELRVTLIPHPPLLDHRHMVRLRMMTEAEDHHHLIMVEEIEIMMTEKVVMVLLPHQLVEEVMRILIDAISCKKRVNILIVG